MEHIKVFLFVSFILMIILIAVVYIGCTIASGIADEKAEKLMDQKINYSKFCDDDCVWCTERQFCKVRDGYKGE